MVRSIWKGVYLGRRNYVNRGSVIFDRSLTILQMYVGKSVQIYTGKKFIKLIVEEGMQKHKFGEFAMTRRIGKVIHTLSKKRNVLKKKK
jgi:ribosomal protein S19